MGNSPPATPAPLVHVTGHRTYRFGDVTRGILGLERPPSPPIAAVPAKQNPLVAAAAGAGAQENLAERAQGAPIAASSPIAGGAGAGRGPSSGTGAGSRVDAERGSGGGNAGAGTAAASAGAAAGAGAGGGYALPPAYAAVAATATATPTPPPPTNAGATKPKLTGGVIWEAFFNRAFEVAEGCVGAGWITGEDVEDQEAYLFFGLPALTMLEGVLRSLHLADATELAMADGCVVTPASCPDEFLPLYTALTATKQAVLTARFSPQELAALRQVVLFAGDHDRASELQGLEASRVVVINRIAGGVQGVATAVSQLPFFKAFFNNVLVLLATSRSL